VGIYQDSKDLSSKENFCFCRVHFDKGGDTINGLVSCHNVERGNSRIKQLLLLLLKAGVNVTRIWKIHSSTQSILSVNSCINL